MQTVTIVFLIWVLAMAVRGYFRGFGKTLAGLVSAILAYAASFIFAPTVAPMAVKWGLHEAYSLLVAGTVLFFGIGLLLSLLAKVILHFGFPKEVSQQSALGGALLGGVLGLLIGFVAIWAYGLVQGTLNAEPAMMADLPEDSIPQQGISRAPSVVEQVSSKFVGGLASLGAKAVGGSDLQVELTSALAENPTVVVQSLQSITQSGQLKNLVNDPAARRAMESRNVADLAETPAFQAFMQQSGMQSLLQVVNPQGEGGEQADQYVAEKFSRIWRRMETVKNDTKVQEILSDPEVQKAIQSQNPLQIIANPKIKKLATHLLQGTDHGDSAVLPEPLKKSTAIYRWRDDQGQVHFTDYEEVPPSKRKSAKLFSE